MNRRRATYLAASAMLALRRSSLLIRQGLWASPAMVRCPFQCGYAVPVTREALLTRPGRAPAGARLATHLLLHPEGQPLRDPARHHSPQGGQ